MTARVECIHYRGARAQCRAGVDVEQLRDDELRLPCVELGGRRGAVDCDLREVTAAPAAAPATGPMRAALAQLEEGRCPTCSGAIEREQVFGDVVVAVPCRHRLRSAPRGRR
ncbi:MAG: hypothetical protein KC464_11815 [Myxococcales bacterium]|nr:hypothetical protein [Myxococcales bacterium]